MDLLLPIFNSTMTTITNMLLIITMAQVEMGLTWIDHDVIEVPVEEIEVGGQRQIISYF